MQHFSAVSNFSVILETLLANIYIFFQRAHAVFTWIMTQKRIPAFLKLLKNTLCDENLLKPAENKIQQLDSSKNLFFFSD